MSTKTTKTRPVLDDEMRNALLDKLETFLAGEGMDVLRALHFPYNARFRYKDRILL